MNSTLDCQMSKCKKKTIEYIINYIFTFFNSIDNVNYIYKK